MALVVQILLLLLLLVALIGTFMSIKNWHWAQMLLMLGIVLFGASSLLLTAETLRTHRALRKGLAGKETDLARVERENEALVRGTRDPGLIGGMFVDGVPFDQEAEGRMPGLPEWNQRLQVLSRERGRVWRGVSRVGAVDPSGKVQVQIPGPVTAEGQASPHNLQKDSVVFAFEQGPPNGADPQQGAQYLGEFRVMEVNNDGAVLQSIAQLDQRTGNRLQNSRVPWSLYETMPSDSHELFVGKDEALLRQLLPEQVVPQYLRQGGPVTPDDDPAYRAYYDEAGRRVGPDDAAAGAEGLQERFDRPLRDYAYLLAELSKQRATLIADRQALVEDNKKLQQAQASAAKLTAYREQEKAALQDDLAKMEADRQAIEKHRDSILAQLATARELLKKAEAYNAELAQLLVDRQLAMVEAIDATAPLPAEAF